MAIAADSDNPISVSKPAKRLNVVAGQFLEPMTLRADT